MKSSSRRTVLAAAALAFLAPVALWTAFTAAPTDSAARAAMAAPNGSQTVVLAGGCFWGLEAVFSAVKGVSAVTSGYAGGNKLTAHYEIVSTGTTGHAEAVSVTYDPAQISFEKLLDVYFTVAHNPTELDRQGPDEGSQYRSEIFYTSEAQKQTAQATIAKLSAAHRFDAPIVTKVEPLHGFYAAEAYHQHFMARHPDYPYIVVNDAPKVAALAKTFPDLVRHSQ